MPCSINSSTEPSPPRVYVVHIAEDSEPLGALLAEQLEAVPGVRVKAVSREAASTLHRARQDPPDLLVLDLQLEGSSAFDVLRDLARPGGMPRVAILTNMAGPETRAACLAAGADAFFDKSTEYEGLLNAVMGWAAAVQAGSREEDCS
jgi:DNA-binding response OmpR family regulator